MANAFFYALLRELGRVTRRDFGMDAKPGPPAKSRAPRRVSPTGTPMRCRSRRTVSGITKESTRPGVAILGWGSSNAAVDFASPEHRWPFGSDRVAHLTKSLI